MDELALIVAVSRNGVIGREGALPWHLPEDLKRFKALTMGHAIIMGRKTWESIGRPLPGRRSIVLSTTAGYRAPGGEVVGDLQTALTLARREDPKPFVIGGETLYAACLPLASELHLTEIHRDAEGDAFFPTFDRGRWREHERIEGEGFTYLMLRKRDASPAT